MTDPAGRLSSTDPAVLDALKSEIEAEAHDCIEKLKLNVDRASENLWFEREGRDELEALIGLEPEYHDAQNPWPLEFDDEFDCGGHDL